MSNFFVARPTLSDAATITSTNVDTDYPVTNLLTQQPREYCRTLDNTDWYVVADLGAAYAIRVIGLLYTNADTSTQWRIRGATSEANLTAAPGYDSTSGDHWPDADLSSWDRTHGLLYLSSAQTYQWWRIDVTGLSGLSYYQTGRLYISGGSSWYQPTRNADIGLSIQYNDASIGVDTAAAHYRRSGKQQRSISASMGYRYKAEAFDDLMSLDRLIGGGGDVLVCVDPDAYVMERLFYCYLDQMGELNHGQWNVANSSNLYSKQYTFMEFERP